MKANETLPVEKCCKVNKNAPLCEGEDAFFELSATERRQSGSLESLSPISQTTFAKFKHSLREQHETRRGEDDLEREMELWKLYRDWHNTFKRKGAARDVETVNAGGYDVKIPVSPLPYCSSSSSTSHATTFMDWGVKHCDDIQSLGYGTPTYDPECIKRRGKYKSSIWKKKDKDRDYDKFEDWDKDVDKDTEKEKERGKSRKRGKKGGREAKKATTGKKPIVPKPPWLWAPSVSSLDDIRSITFERPSSSSIGSCSSLVSKLDEMYDDKDGKQEIKLWPEEELQVPEEVAEGKKGDMWLKKLERKDADEGTLAAFEEPLLYRYPSDAQLADVPYGGAWAIYMKEKENELLEAQVGDEESTSEGKIPLTPTESIKIWQFPPTDDITGEVTAETASAYGECTPRPPNTSPVQISGVWALAGDELAREQREWEEALERDRVIDDMERQLLQDSEGEASVDTHVSDTTAPSNPPEVAKEDKPQTWWEFNHTYRRGHSAFSSAESLEDDIYNIDDVKLVGSDAEEKSSRDDAQITDPNLAEEEQPESIDVLSADEETEPLLYLRQYTNSGESLDSWDAYEPEERDQVSSKQTMERPLKATAKKNKQGPAERTPLRRREFQRDPPTPEKPRQMTQARQIQKKPPRPSRELPPLRLRGAGPLPVNDLEEKNQEKKAAGDTWQDHMPPLDEWIDLYKETMRRLHKCAWGRDPDRRRTVQIDESILLPHAPDTTGGGDTKKSSALMHEIKQLLALRDTANEVMRPDRSSYIDVFQGEVNAILKTVRGDILVVDVEIMKQLDLYKGQIESIGVRRFVNQVHVLPPLTLDSIFGVFLWSSHVQAREGDIADEASFLSESDASDDSDTDLFSETGSSLGSSSEGDLTDDESIHAASMDSDKKRKKKKKRDTETQEFVVLGEQKEKEKEKEKENKKQEVPNNENPVPVKVTSGTELETTTSFFEPRRKRAVVQQTLFDAIYKMTRLSAAISKDPELSEDTMALLHAIVSGASTGRLRNMLRAADALGSWSLSGAILRLMGRAMTKEDSTILKGLVHSLTQGTWLPYYICHTRACFEDHLRKSADYKAPYMENYPTSFGGIREKTQLFNSRRTAQMPSPRSSLSSSLDSDTEERRTKVSRRPKSTLSPRVRSMKKSTMRSGKKKGRSKLKPQMDLLLPDEV